MKEHYEDHRFNAEKRGLIKTCDEILQEYIDEGYTITVRTLYYQLVARAIIPNNEHSYKNLTGLVNAARLAGMLDWDVIEDRGRKPVVRSRWGTPQEFLQSVLPQFHHDMWVGQENRVFVVVEKDALAGVLERTCYTYDVPLLAAKGYPSSSSLRDLVLEHMLPHEEENQTICILHMGDHDPSGIDMSRDLDRRLFMFGSSLNMDFQRIALNMPQIEELNPPPNPAKLSDSRSEDYIKRYGDESWELDALTPQYLNTLLRNEITQRIDNGPWNKRLKGIEVAKQKFEKIIFDYT